MYFLGSPQKLGTGGGSLQHHCGHSGVQAVVQQQSVSLAIPHLPAARAAPSSLAKPRDRAGQGVLGQLRLMVPVMDCTGTEQD